MQPLARVRFSRLTLSVARSAGRMCACVVVVAVVALTAHAQSADEFIQTALETYSRGNVAEAIPLLEEAEKKFPFHAAASQVLFFLASAYIDEAEFAKANTTLTKLRERYGKYADSLPSVDRGGVLEARCMARQGKTDQAVAHLRKFLNEKPKSDAVDFAKIEMARAFMEADQLDKATPILTRLGAHDRSDERDNAIMLLAEIAAKRGEFEKTEKLMRGLARTADDKAARNQALFQLGEIYRKSGNLVKSIDAYRRIKIQGDDQEAQNFNAGILFEIAQTYENLNHPLEAHIGFRGVHDFYPDTAISTEAWHRAILSDIDYGNVDRAIGSYRTFLKDMPTRDVVNDVRYYAGRKLADENNYDAAIEQYTEGLREFPTGEFAESTFYELGVAQLGDKRFLDAERTLDDFAKKFPGSELLPRSYFYLAQAYLEQDRFSEAIDTFSRVARDFADSDVGANAGVRADETRLIYADYLMNTGEYQKAAIQCRNVTTPDLKEQALLRVGDIYLQGELYADAATAFDTFIGAFPDSPFVPVSRYSRGEALMQVPDYPGAEGAFQALIDSDVSRTNELLPAAQMQIAFCRYFQDDVPGMSNALVTVVDTYPAQPEAGEALYWLGYLNRSTRAYEAAAGIYQDLVSRYPTHRYAPEAAYLVGECYVLDNKEAFAPKYFIDAFTAYPRDPFAALALMRAGETFLYRHQLDGWLMQLDTLSTNTPAGADALAIARAGVLLRAGRIDEADAAFDTVRLASLSPAMRGYALALKAGILREQGNLEDAIANAAEAADVAAAEQFGLDEALFQLARSLETAGQFQDAEGVYARLLSDTVIPNNRVNAAALVGRAHCLVELGRLTEVIALCDDATKLRPGHEIQAQALLLKGDAAFAMNDWNKAAQYFKRASILYGGLEKYGVEAYRKLIDSYTQLGLTQQADEARKKLAQQYPNANALQ